MSVTAEEAPSIHVQGLSKRFGQVVALEDVDLTIGPGVFALLGPNGAGKTTLMRILATVFDPDAGRVSVGGHDLPRDKEPVRRILGYLPQEFGVYRRVTGRQFLDYVALLRGIADPRRPARRVEEVLELVNLREAAGPELARDRVVVFSTHLLADARRLDARILVLVRGRPRFLGTVEALAARAAGRAWAVTLPAGDRALSDLQRRCRVASLRPADGSGHVEVRLVAEERPHPDARPVAPEPEEGYLACLADGEDA